MKQFLSAQFWFLLSGLAILGGCTPQKTETSALPESYTRGIGMYPGDIKEYMAPKMEKDFTYR